MKTRLKFSTMIVYAICAFVAVVSVLAFINGLSWVNKTFPGFLIYKFPYVASMRSMDWPGMKVGVKLMERVVSADGRSLREGQDLLNLVKEKEVGTPVNYTIEWEGKTRHVAIQTAQFSFKDFLLAFLIPFVFGILLFSLGLISYLMKPGSATSWVFFVFCLVMGIYAITAFDGQSTYTLQPVHLAATCVMTAPFFHLGLIYPERKKFLRYHPFLEYLIYVPGIILALIFEIHLFTVSKSPDWILLRWIPDFKEVTALARIFTLICGVSLVLMTLEAMFRTSSKIVKQRAKMIIFGVAIGFLLPGTIMLITHFLKVSFPWNFLPFFAIFFPAAIAYSIVRHNLFDADTIIKRTVGYVVVTAVVVGAYVLVSIFFNVFLGQYQVSQSKAFPIVFTLIIILIFNPLRNRIQSLVDRLFFRKEYDYGEIVEKVGDAMTSLLELPLILKRLVKTFMEDMFINTSSVMLLTPAGAEFQVVVADGEKKEAVERVTLKQDDPLMEIIRREKRELTRYDVIEDPKYRTVSESCTADFARLNASLIVPLVYQNQLIGSLNLGEKKSGKPFKREDIDLLRALAHQGAVAIENARLFKENLEKQRMEEELSIARDLQMSMLPATCPQVQGFGIAATSVPAKEVGGDFFDFIEMGEGKLGLVIGDVTGKSVSGALVMSASRSIFRMLSEEKLTVGDIMIRANKRIKKDIKSGMFVALLYAVLDGRNRILSFCSAGQTQPIYSSSRTGEVRLQETLGDKFPLGILEESDYQETQLKFEPGDKVVFYTDGIVEAMNAKEEIFGFDRLLELVQSSRSMTAEALLKEALSKVKEFVGEAPQHDDLTVVVVSVDE